MWILWQSGEHGKVSGRQEQAPLRLAQCSNTHSCERNPPKPCWRGRSHVEPVPCRARPRGPLLASSMELVMPVSEQLRPWQGVALMCPCSCCGCSPGSQPWQSAPPPCNTQSLHLNTVPGLTAHCEPQIRNITWVFLLNMCSHVCTCSPGDPGWVRAAAGGLGWLPQLCPACPAWRQADPGSAGTQQASPCSTSFQGDGDVGYSRL